MKTLDKNKNYIYHSTNSKHVESILSNGINSDKTSIDSQLIMNVLENNNCELPFDRGDVNYFHINEEIVEYGLNLDINQKPVYVVVDFSEINHQTYLADMSIITQVLDYSCAGEWILREYESIEQVIQTYIDNIYEITTVNELYEYNKKIEGNTELIIDGDISPSKIVDVLY